jgi:RNA polymerase sigma factor (sigma-70 family)
LPDVPVSPTRVPPTSSCPDTLVRHLPDVHRAIRMLGRRHRLPEQEEGDLLGEVLVRLVTDDYAVLRKYRGDSALGTYLRSVAYRVLLDSRIRRWGKWRPSSRARALGTSAVHFERLVARDGFTVSEARAIVDNQPHLALAPPLTDALAAGIGRRRRPRTVPLEMAAGVPVEASQDAVLESRALSQRAARVSSAMRLVMQSLSPGDSLLLRQRFVEGHSVTDLARHGRADQKSLYRRYARILRRLRTDLEHADVTADDVRSLIGRGDVEISGVLSPAAVLPAGRQNRPSRRQSCIA